MTLDDVVLEYGRAQLTIIELQKQVRFLNAKIAELTKKSDKVEDTKEMSSTADVNVPIPNIQVKRGRPKAVSAVQTEPAV